MNCPLCGQSLEFGPSPEFDARRPYNDGIDAAYATCCGNDIDVWLSLKSVPATVDIEINFGENLSDATIAQIVKAFGHTKL